MLVITTSSADINVILELVLSQRNPSNILLATSIIIKGFFKLGYKVDRMSLWGQICVYRHVFRIKSQKIGVILELGDTRQLLDNVAIYFVVWAFSETSSPVILCEPWRTLIFSFWCRLFFNFKIWPTEKTLLLIDDIHTAACLWEVSNTKFKKRRN